MRSAKSPRDAADGSVEFSGEYRHCHGTRARGARQGVPARGTQSVANAAEYLARTTAFRSINNSMLLHLANGTVYDPARGRSGVVADLWLRDGKVVDGPLPGETPARRIDATGMVVMPGGVDMHTHIAGPKVNAARRLRPDDRRDKVMPRTAATRSGTLGSVPSTFATGYLYAGLGYTTAVDAAIPPLGARHAHLELADTPIIDPAILLSLGDHLYGFEMIAKGEQERLSNFVAWMLRATHAYGVKLVNPGGVETYKQGGRRGGLDAPVAPFDISPRQIVLAYSTAVDALRLPHAVHVHCADLGRPGNAETTLASMRALEGRRAHFTHIQFHSYGGGRDDPAGFRSRVPELADYVNNHPEITVDVGQVLPGETTALTGDSAAGHFLARSTGRRHIDFDLECEGGCGVVPLTYRYRSLVTALQWAIGLEWFLLVKDPWRVAMSTDHPNGAAFVAYPEIIQLLMSRDYRREVLGCFPEAVRSRCVLPDLHREYTLEEVAIVTRAGPARILGMTQKGRLDVGADADVAVYSPSDDRKAMFEMPRYVIKAGEVIVEQGEVRRTVFGPTQTVAPVLDEGHIPAWRAWFAKHYTIQFANFSVADDRLEHGRVVNACR